MIHDRIGRVSLCVLILTFGLVSNTPAQDKPTDPTSKPNRVRSESKNVFDKWLNEDVGPIVTEAERKAFGALKTNEERENFISIFWRLRDPDPDTLENEYREEYYQRIAYANERFASGIPGWKSDRGRIYIAWGKPDSIESHPSGGSYERPSWEGGGSTSTYPFEIWFYRHLDGVGDGVEIEFVDPTGTGEYRLATNANEKDALLHVPGAGQTLAEQLNISNKADRIAGISSGNSFQRVQDGPFERQLLRSLLARAPRSPSPSSLIGTGTDSPVLDKNPLDFDLRVDFFRQSEDKVMVAFTVQAENKGLRFADDGSGLATAKLNIVGHVTAVTGTRASSFEDAVTTTSTIRELSEAKQRRSVYQKVITLAPGTYKADVIVRDVETGNRGIVNQGFVVPRYDSKKLSTSSLVIASRLRSTDVNDIGRMFIIGNAKVVPNLEGIFRRGDEVGIYLQVYNAGIDQTTLRPAVDVQYVLTKAGKEILKQPEDWKGLSDSSQRLTLARLLPTTTLDPGEYEIKVVTKDRINGTVVENKGKFTITN